jgi:3-oxoacyl-[acyl-carrier-protein] synthase II
VGVGAGGSGLRAADVPEAAAIARVFGGGARVFEPRRLLGEPMGAGGALNTVLASMSLRRGHTTGPALILSSSLGGTHFALVLGDRS